MRRGAAKGLAMDDDLGARYDRARSAFVNEMNDREHRARLSRQIRIALWLSRIGFALSLLSLAFALKVNL